MFRKVSRERAKDREKEFLLERKAAGCTETCDTICGTLNTDFSSERWNVLCEAP